MRVNQNPRRRRIPPSLAALIAVALVGLGPARAQTEAPVFFIETITVETERLSPEIVLSESLLRKGREYSETELREAVHRINRLPFVLLAEFSLAKGSARGRYELVIQIYETKRWFFQIGLAYEFNDPFGPFRLIGDVDDIDERLRFEDDELDALVGRRFALGPRSLLFASFASEEGLFALGYQRYNLWDRNILFSVTVASDGEGDAFEKSRAARAQLGIPLRGNHALRLLTGWDREESRFFRGFGGFESEKLDAEIAWVFNSRDDPVLPREGALFEAGLIWSRFDERQDFTNVDGEQVVSDTSESLLGVVGTAARHWPLGSRQSLSAAVGGSFGDGIGDSELLEVQADLGHQVFLVRNLEPGKWRELRLETTLSGLYQELSAGDPAFGLPDSLDGWRVRTGLTYRSGWGLFRLVFDYADRDFE